jgi:predicted DNA-binding mobile mystery protein A
MLTYVKSGSLTLKTMNKIAQAMGCRFIYVIIPDHKVEELILKQAQLRAKNIVNKTNVQMALEDQLLSEDKIQFEIDRLAQEIIKDHPRDLWNTEDSSKLG